jgi:hypothetical protein
MLISTKIAPRHVVSPSDDDLLQSAFHRKSTPVSWCGGKALRIEVVKFQNYADCKQPDTCLKMHGLCRKEKWLMVLVVEDDTELASKLFSDSFWFE